MKKFLIVLLALACFVSIASAELTYGQSFYDKNVSMAFSRGSNDPLKGFISEVENLIEVGTPLGTGHVFYVDSNVTSEGDGTTWAKAKDTLDEAVNLCTANRGDIILVAQGHSETMGAAADEVDIDVAGVTVIGIGSGSLQPKFDYTGKTTGAFAIGADDVAIANLNFHANITDVNEAIDVEAGSTGVSIVGCVFDTETEGTYEFLECIDSTGAASDRLSVVGCSFYMGAGACNAAVCTKDSDYCVVKNNVCFGDYATACINNLTTASNHILITGNTLFNGTIGGNGGLNAQPGIELVATTTGIISNNFIGCNLATKAAAIVGADCYLFENYYNEDESSAGTGGLIGTASADDS